MSTAGRHLRSLWLLLLCVLPVVSVAQPTLAEADGITSTHFIVSIDGHPAPVLHAASNLYFLNFDARRHQVISVTAPSDDFWTRGVEVQPWRLGIRPRVQGRTITFELRGTAKISISRPGDHLANAEMLYLFANPPVRYRPRTGTTSLRVYGPGIHHENIDAASGDNIYLAAGAVVFGTLNIWQVDHVNVWGRGVIVYDGPQNPADDDGYMHKKNWHCIVMDNAHDISIEGITCVVRSRTWQIQMKNSRRIAFDNIKVIGANTGNANADGLDWLGGGDTFVRNSFFRAADDIFALQTSWDGYGPEAFAEQGEPVTNIVVENSVLSTSISNIVRAGWPEKNFEGGNFTLRNADVLHMGLGGCGVPFALMELWADPNGRGNSAGFHFDDVRLEDWTSLVQLRQPTDGIHDVSFKDVSSLEQPALVPSLLKGNVQNVAFDNLSIAGSTILNQADVPLLAENGASPPSFLDVAPKVSVLPLPPLVQAGQKIHFEARPAPGQPDALDYTWIFGDGTQAHGRKVSHRFPDADGTLHDGTGWFRVLLHVESKGGRQLWIPQSVIITAALKPALPQITTQPGLNFSYTAENTGPPQSRTGLVPLLQVNEVEPTASAYSIVFEGELEVPADGAYAFVVIANDSTSFAIDGVVLGTTPEPFAQVCGLVGNAAQAVTVHAALARGRHHLQVTEAHSIGQDDLRVLWRGPGFGFQEVPAPALSHGIHPVGPPWPAFSFLQKLQAGRARRSEIAELRNLNRFNSLH